MTFTEGAAVQANINARAIAYSLDQVQSMSMDYVLEGWFSQMDQCVLKLLEAYPQLRKAHSAFSQSRQQIGFAKLTDESWQKMQHAARELAEAVRGLGDINIKLCERPVKYGSGACGHALMPDGTCAIRWHIND